MLTVRDIMQQQVLTVRPEETVRDLTRLLAAQGISGVPVVSPAGHVLGVVSSTDIVRLSAEEAEVHIQDARWLAAVPSRTWNGESQEEGDEDDGNDALTSYFLPEDNPLVEPDWAERMGQDTFDEFRVEDIMTPVSFSIGPNATIQELADFLVRGRIHRAIVSEGDHLVGIVTTMDVLRAIASRKL